MKKNHKTLVSALAFFAAVALVGVNPANAQIDLLHQTCQPDTNPLLATSGPNTVGAGHLQLSGALTWDYLGFESTLHTLENDYQQGKNIYNNYGAGVSLRYGLGQYFELNASVDGAYSHSISNFGDTIINEYGKAFSPCIGAKFYFYQGGGDPWVPRMALAAGLSTLMSVHNGNFYINYIAPRLDLQFRNRLGRRWTLDYSVGVDAAPTRLGIRSKYGFIRYSLFTRWLATDRLLFSAGVENGEGRLEMLYQVKPDLQLSAHAAVSAIAGFEMGMLQTYAAVGVNWMLK